MTFAFPAEGARAQSEWRLSSQPSLRIGDERNENTQFLNVRYVARGSHGEIVVHNWSTRELRVFRANGTYLASFGRAGAGPNEFRNMSVSARVGDTLIITDHGLDRITRFVIGQGFIETKPTRPGGTLVDIVDRLQSGDYFVQEMRPARADRLNGVSIDSFRLGVMTSSASPTVRWFGRFAGWPYFSWSPKGSAHVEMVTVYPLGSAIRTTALGNEMLVGYTGSASLQVVDVAGKIVRNISLPLRLQPFDERQIARAQREAIDGSNDPRAKLMQAEMYKPEHRGRNAPLYTSLKPSRDGSLWVQLFKYAKSDTTRYLVVDSRGKSVATVSVPPNITLYEVDKDYVLGVAKDDDGVETVVMYSIVR
jgi:hypothetical protein